jgi:hypothetical protein
VSQAASTEENPFTPNDRETLLAEGLSEERVLAQLDLFKLPPSYTRLDRPCGVNDGIVRLSPAERSALSETFAGAAAAGRAMQFTPASGAATRMFKGLLAVAGRSEPPAFADLSKEAQKGGADAKETVEWWNGIRKFAFAGALERVLAAAGLDLDALIAAKDYRPALEAMLRPSGLGYADKPKAVIPFHKSPDGAKTAIEEHLAEAAALVRDAQSVCRIHFTVSGEHERMILSLLDGVRGALEADGLRLEIGLSQQKRSTDTVAADAENRPFRDADGSLIFRPGGHGALLENLFHTGGDLVFIRNIDNTLPRSPAREEALAWRRALGGYLAGLQERAFAHLRRLMEGADPETVEEAARFVEQRLGTVLPENLRAPAREEQAREEKRAFLLKTLDRPMRVAAMVRNQGEPGGGPFWVRHKDGAVRMQIVEQAQVEMGNSQQRKIAESASHFNPVDMACALRNHRGELFKLQDYVDSDAYLVSTKSKDGKPLKALELPGLWNGSMAYWNTAFVEVPVEIFNPVKTVNDLLRPAHAGVPEKAE